MPPPLLPRLGEDHLEVAAVAGGVEPGVEDAGVGEAVDAVVHDAEDAASPRPTRYTRWQSGQHTAADQLLQSCLAVHF